MEPKPFPRLTVCTVLYLHGRRLVQEECHTTGEQLAVDSLPPVLPAAVQHLLVVVGRPGQLRPEGLQQLQHGDGPGAAQLGAAATRHAVQNVGHKLYFLGRLHRGVLVQFQRAGDSQDVPEILATVGLQHQLQVADAVAVAGGLLEKGSFV